MITEQQLADIAAHMAMRLGQAEARLAAKHPRAAKDGELASMLNDLDDHITVLRGHEQEPEEVWHEHEFQGQKLRHAHVGGGQQNHGYFQHPEDGFR